MIVECFDFRWKDNNRTDDAGYDLKYGFFDSGYAIRGSVDGEAVKLPLYDDDHDDESRFIKGMLTLDLMGWDRACKETDPADQTAGKRWSLSFGHDCRFMKAAGGERYPAGFKQFLKLLHDWGFPESVLEAGM